MEYLIYMILLISSTQTQSTCHVKGRQFEGYIFDKKHFVMASIPHQKSRYTPTCEDVIIAEKILKMQLPAVNKPSKNQGDKCPNIVKNLRKYKRQYVGFTNEKGEKILWVNFIWNKNTTQQVSKDIISVFDGCSFYWNIHINITAGVASGLDING